MYKGKLSLSEKIDFKVILDTLQKVYRDAEFNTIDGIKIDFTDSWIHLRRSNTEPIVRIYTEAKNPQKAQKLAQEVIEILQKPNLSS